MPAQTDDDTIRNLIQSAEARLKRAETYDATTRPELTCEDAQQQTAELALKALIKAHGGVYKRTHEIEHLLETLEDLGETILAAIEPAKELTDYGGAERYEFITGDADALPNETVTDAVKAARETFTWCTTRIRALKPGLSLETPQIGQQAREPATPPGTGAGSAAAIETQERDPADPGSQDGSLQRVAVSRQTGTEEPDAETRETGKATAHFREDRTAQASARPRVPAQLEAAAAGPPRGRGSTPIGNGNREPAQGRPAGAGIDPPTHRRT